MNTKIITSTYRIIDLAEVKPNDIDLKDIAEGLSNIIRFNGRGWSVLEHSLAMYEFAKARMFPKRVQIECLLHDAPEAYIGDIIKPVKELIPQISAYEDTLLSTIYESLNVPVTHDEDTKKIDMYECGGR